MGEVEFITLFKSFGPLVVFLAYFIWRDKAREERLGKRLDEVQDRQATTFLTVIQDNTKAMQAAAAATQQSAAAMERLTSTVEAMERASTRERV